MDLQLFQDYGPVERLRMLESNAEQIIEKYSFERRLTEEELAARRADFAQKTIEVEAEIEELKSVVAETNATIKLRKRGNANLLNEIRWQREERTEKVFCVQDFEENKIGLYTADGTLIETRRMEPGQRQMRLTASVRTGTDG